MKNPILASLLAAACLALSACGKFDTSVEIVTAPPPLERVVAAPVVTNPDENGKIQESTGFASDAVKAVVPEK